MVGLVLMPARTQIDLRDSIQPACRGGVEQGGELHPVPHRDAKRLHKLAPRRPFPGQGLHHARQLGPPQAQQWAGYQLGDPAAFGRGGAVRPGRDPGVEPLDQLNAGIGEKRPEQAGHEVRTPLGEVGVDEDKQVTLGDEQRLPQGLALAGIAAVLRRDVAGPVHGRAGLGGRGRRPVGRIRVDDHHLIDQWYPLHQGRAERTDHARDGALLVARGNHHADPRVSPPLALQQHLGRPVPPMPGPPPVPRLRAAVHSCYLLASPAPVERTAGNHTRHGSAKPTSSRYVSARPVSARPADARPASARPASARPSRLLTVLAGHRCRVERPCPGSPLAPVTQAVRAAPTGPWPVFRSR